MFWTKMRKRDRRSEKGFTLIELLIVITILGILATIAGPRVLSQRDKAKVAKVRVELNVFKQALEQYSLDNGDYPTTEQGLQALWEPPTIPPEATNWDPDGYIDRPNFNDPWGNPYVYRYPGTHERFPFDLYSLGKDGKEGGTGYDADISVFEDITQQQQ